MYTLKKDGGMWCAIDSRGLIQFRSLSRRTVREWIERNSLTQAF